ncbi:rhamnan synthesis F family protein [Acetobacter vaccinii]|uniref:Glycosyl transferase n=1 Tax=Acetobacter vaccinii TaxID=2592655 RepID=A0A5C1YPC9_9PROT|nr:rhamnan synthesis F family protein [Acetobacter vaccinii]QEO16937.1 glycosyl transferase [Acetobacter vaccinii]
MADTPFPTGSICLFAAYTPDGNLPEYTRHYLRELTHNGLTTHCIFSGCQQVSPSSALFCQQHGIYPWPRANDGLDFGAWQFLLAQGVAHTAPYIVLANDSVLGPLRPLRHVLHAHTPVRYPVWGMVATRLVTPHLQSWFVGLSHTVLHTPHVQRVLALPFASMSRAEIIWHGELGLSVAIREAGFPLHAAWSDLHTPMARMCATNPMHTRWYSLAASGQVPFLKRELLRDNPFGLPGLQHWRQTIPVGSAFQPDWIADLRTEAPRPRATRPNWKGRALYALAATADRVVHGLRPVAPPAPPDD